MAFFDIALRCTTAGLRVFPVTHPGIDLEPKGKRPAIRGWPTKATTDATQIEKWAAKWPNYNCGICTTDYLALDIDGAEGVESLRNLEAEHGRLPVTMKTVSSGPDRFHLVFRMPAGLQAISSTGKLGPKLDMKGCNSFVVAPGSVHQSGAVYTSVVGPETIAQAPPWLLALVKTRPTELRDHAEASPCPSFVTARTRTAPGPAGASVEGKAFQNAGGATRGDYTLGALVEEVVERFPASLENRHAPMVKMVGSLTGGKGLDDETIIEVGTAWLRHYEGQYGLTFERALAELHKCVDYTRGNEKFVPLRRNIADVELSPRERFVIECVAETRDEELFLEAVLREWRLDQEAFVPRKRDVVHTTYKPNVGFVGVENNVEGKEEKEGREGEVHLALEGKESGAPLTLTVHQLLAGFQLLSGGRGDLRNIMKLRARFFTLNPAPYGDGQVSSGSRANRVELFRRTQVGTQGKPSLYVPSPCLLELLAGKNPFWLKKLANLFALDRKKYLHTRHWKRFREKILRRDDGRCQCCGRRSGLRVVWTWQGWEPQGAEAGFADDYATVCSGCHMIALALRADEPIIIAGKEMKQIDSQRLARIVRVFRLVEEKHARDSRTVGRGDNHVGVANQPAGGEPVTDRTCGGSALPSQAREVAGEDRDHEPVGPAPRAVGVRLPAAGLGPGGDGQLPGLRETGGQGTGGLPPVPGCPVAAPDECPYPRARPIYSRDAHRAAAATVLATAGVEDRGAVPAGVGGS